MNSGRASIACHSLFVTIITYDTVTFDNIDGCHCPGSLRSLRRQYPRQRPYREPPLLRNAGNSARQTTTAPIHGSDT